MSRLGEFVEAYEAGGAAGGARPGARRVAAALRALGVAGEQELELICAALLPGIGLPPSAPEEERTSSRARALVEARAARVALWEAGIPVLTRERVCQLVALRGLPLRVSALRDPERSLRRAALSVPLPWLARLAEAEARARPERDELLASVELFRELVAAGGLEGARFADPWSRFRYFRDPSRDPAGPVYDASRAEVVLTSGPPGVGKSTWCRRERGEWPRVSLDELRAELKVSPRDDQGPVAALARARAREYLRAERSFVWEGTNLSADLRRQVVDLCDAYGARVRLVCVEAPAALATARNRARSEPVPEAAIARMLRRWDFPDLAEAWEREIYQSGE